MGKDLTTSRIDRQNILNNELAIEEMHNSVDTKMVFWNDKYYFTKEMLASYFDVETRTIERYISAYSEELKENGYELLKGKKLLSFIAAYDSTFATDININQRDKDFIGSSLQEENYRRKFTDALKHYVVEDRYKYAHFTDMIYVSIFREKAHEYKKILDLKASDKVRDTFYSEILDIIAAYESGLADAVKNEYESLGHPLSIAETEALFRRFESMALWKPLIHRGRTKMASRDMALRDAVRIYSTA